MADFIIWGLLIMILLSVALLYKLLREGYRKESTTEINSLISLANLTRETKINIRLDDQYRHLYNHHLAEFIGFSSISFAFFLIYSLLKDVKNLTTLTNQFIRFAREISSFQFLFTGYDKDILLGVITLGLIVPFCWLFCKLCKEAKIMEHHMAAQLPIPQRLNDKILIRSLGPWIILTVLLFFFRK
jgi:hypothetical protein